MSIQSVWQARKWALGFVVITAPLTAGCSGSVEEQEETTGTEKTNLAKSTDVANPGSSENGATPNPGGPNMPGPGMTNPAVPKPIDSKPVDPKQCGFGAPRVWKLTPEQYTRTVQALVGPAVGRPGDDLKPTLAAQKVGFSNEAGGLSMSEPHVSALLKNARTLAATISADAKLLPCAAAPEAVCVKAFIDSFGQRTFRRPLTPAEIDRYVAFFSAQAQAHDPKTAARLLVTGLLMSPDFLYRTELGPEGAGKMFALTPYERAQSVSYFLTSGPPDATLYAAARMGKLETKEQLAEQAARLVMTVDRGVGWQAFFSEHFDTQNVKLVRKETKVYPDWKAEHGSDLARESEAFIQQVLWKEDAKFATLLTAPYSMVNGRLMALYGAGTSVATEFVKTILPQGQRAGLLTQGGLMASLSRENDTDPVMRGRFVRETVLCQPPPPPPATVNAVPPPPDGKNTQRERLASHSKDPSCAGCHSLMDPLGLAFESYDGIGKYRTTDVGKALDTSGKLTSARPENAPWRNAVELVGILAISPDAQACLASKAFEWGQGRVVSPADACALSAIAKRFEGSGGNLLDLAVAIASDDSFFTRQTP